MDPIESIPVIETRGSVDQLDQLTGRLLAERFEAHRGRLHAVAYRMFGTPNDADDAVQETWLRLSRLSRADLDRIVSLEGWLRTVVSRICLDMLRTRRSRREEPLPQRGPAHPPRGWVRAHATILTTATWRRQRCSSTRSAAPCSSSWTP